MICRASAGVPGISRMMRTRRSVRPLFSRQLAPLAVDVVLETRSCIATEQDRLDQCRKSRGADAADAEDRALQQKIDHELQHLRRVGRRALEVAVRFETDGCAPAARRGSGPTEQFKAVEKARAGAAVCRQVAASVVDSGRYVKTSIFDMTDRRILSNEADGTISRKIGDHRWPILTCSRYMGWIALPSCQTRPFPNSGS
jgi:hypothetical protein